VHDAAAVGVEKHDFFTGFEAWRRLRHAGRLQQAGRLCNVRLRHGVGVG
jgi:hypothetical protein